jgi:hypothetical protein
MILNIYIDNSAYQIDVTPEILEEGKDFFTRMDRDMDKGWQMSRQYVEHPDTVQRCQIAADKILSALHTDNHKLALLMAGYILTRLPGVKGVQIDTNGEIFNTTLITPPEADTESPRQD